MSYHDKKHDQGKLRYDLLPWTAIAAVVQVLTFGAAKRDNPTPEQDREGRRSMPDGRTRYFSALMRHVLAWWSGERVDPESGVHHLAHAMCNALFLMELDTEAAEPTDAP